MVRVDGTQGPFCIHAWEVSLPTHSAGPATADRRTGIQSVKGGMPVLVSWQDARTLCQEAGFHLCTSEEWEDACDGTPGAGGRSYPTPDGAWVTGRCGVASYQERFAPPLAVTGSYPKCRTPEGVWDMAGNAWEWADPEYTDAAGNPVTDKRGAAHYSGSPATCAFDARGLHPPSFTGTIGFRCCAPAP